MYILEHHPAAASWQRTIVTPVCFAYRKVSINGNESSSNGWLYNDHHGIVGNIRWRSSYASLEAMGHGGILCENAHNHDFCEEYLKYMSSHTAISDLRTSATRVTFTRVYFGSPYRVVTQEPLARTSHITVQLNSVPPTHLALASLCRLWSCRCSAGQVDDGLFQRMLVRDQIALLDLVSVAVVR